MRQCPRCGEWKKVLLMIKDEGGLEESPIDEPGWCEKCWSELVDDVEEVEER